MTDLNALLAEIEGKAKAATDGRRKADYDVGGGTFSPPHWYLSIVDIPNKNNTVGVHDEPVIMSREEIEFLARMDKPTVLAMSAVVRAAAAVDRTRTETWMAVERHFDLDAKCDEDDESACEEVDDAMRTRQDAEARHELALKELRAALARLEGMK